MCRCKDKKVKDNTFTLSKKEVKAMKKYIKANNLEVCFVNFKHTGLGNAVIIAEDQQMTNAQDITDPDNW